MRNTLLCFLLLGVPLIAMAQFYPEANACWSGRDNVGVPPGFDIMYQIGAAPDTLINGVVYKKTNEFRDWNFTRAYFVRSDQDGKGFVYLPDSAAEFLTGDLAAQTGDTIHDVLINDTDEFDVGYYLVDVVVDSVVTFSNAGVTVIRHFVNFDMLGMNPSGSFWQMGMGTSVGPTLEVTAGLWYCTVGDTVMYDRNNMNGLPGPIGVDVCPLIIDGIGSAEPTEPDVVQALPNPSHGQFALSGVSVQSFIVHDVQGSTVVNGKGSVIDLSEQAPGLYTAVVTTGQGVQNIRLVLMRE
jgi:hypothetical protein